jgi:uncharacterized protein
MASQDVETLRAGYEAFARQDIPAVLAAFDPQITWRTSDSLPFGGTYQGHDGVVSFFQKLGEHFQEIEVEPLEFIDGDDTIVVLCRDRVAAAGGSNEQQTVHLWRMRDGKAAEFTEFLDAAPILQILGTPAAAGA